MKLLTLITTIGGALMLSCVLWAGTVPPDVALTLDPTTGIQGGPSSDTVGWGFTLSTDSDYILIDSFEFDETTPVGTFTAFVPPFAAASSGSPLTEPFDNGAGTGVGSYLIGSVAPGSSSIGDIVVTYDVFDSDPNANPNAIDLFSGLQASAYAEVDVTGTPGTGVVPEPVSLPFLCSCCLLLFLGDYVRKSRAPFSSHGSAAAQAPAGKEILESR
jgi:hypothetical protein